MSDAQLIILDEIHARLEGLRVANGYRFDVEKSVVKRAKLTPFQNGDLPAINYWPTTDTLTDKSGQIEARSFNITLEIYSLTRDEPFTDVSTRMGNDVVTALFRSTAFPKASDSKSLALGGLVDELTINSITPMIGEGNEGWCAALIDATVKFKIEVGDFSSIFSY